jgi:hypothetical protein
MNTVHTAYSIGNVEYVLARASMSLGAVDKRLTSMSLVNVTKKTVTFVIKEFTVSRMKSNVTC